MSIVALRSHAAAGHAVGQGRPTTAEDLAAVGGPLLVHASRWTPDVVLRSGLIWPVLQHAAWVWRDSNGPGPMSYALALQVRADMMVAMEVALDGVGLALAGAAASGALPRVRRALFEADPDADGGAGLPPALPADVVLPLALRRWRCPEALPGDLFVKAQLFTAATFARVDGFSRREVVDAFVDVLDDLGPVVTEQLARMAA